MRLGRIVFILFAIYLIFLGGSAYYTLVFPVRQLHHILLTLVLVLWLLLRLRRGGLPQTPLNLPITISVIIWVISAALSIDPRMAFENLWFLIIHVLFFYIVVDLFQRGRQHMIMETVFMVGTVVVLMSALELASWYFGLGILPNTQIGWIHVISTGMIVPLKPLRLSLAMNISTLLAGFVAPLITVTAVWALTTWKKPFSRILWLLTGCLLMVLVMTFSRGGLLSILTAAGTLGALQFSQIQRVTKRIPTRFLLGGAVFIGVVIVSGYVIFSITQARRNDTGDAGRLDMWRSAVAITKDFPITGVGPGIYGRAFRDYRDPTIVQDKLASAHNAYLNTAAETGIIGIIGSLWLASVLLRTWYNNWKQTESPARKLRLAGAFAALLGLGVHSMVDVFTITPIVLVIVVLTAYCITPTEMVYEGQRDFSPITVWRKLPIYAAVIIVIGYGIWFNQLDRAQAFYMDSFDNSDMAMISAQNAATIDPSLHLYPLQQAYQKGTLDGSNAINDYQAALALEPTWDVGWMNLAALVLQSGDTKTAVSYLDSARKINVHTPASLHWARLSEETSSAPEAAIIEAYVNAIEGNTALPLSTFWKATPLRRAAVDSFLATQPIDIQYRVYSVLNPSHALTLVQQNPTDASEWWVTGEYALSITGDTEAATHSFSEAIRLHSAYGDYYVSRARATYQNDPESAKRDLNIAQLLGTSAEYPYAIWAELASIPAEREKMLAQALPPKIESQEFAGVLYGRPSIFQVIPTMQWIGPGHSVMQPWYTLAEERLAAGNLDGAIRVYEAILAYAPDETEALDRLAQHSHE